MLNLSSKNADTRIVTFTHTAQEGTQSPVFEAHIGTDRTVTFTYSFFEYLCTQVLGVSTKTAQSRLKAQGRGYLTAAAREVLTDAELNEALDCAAKRKLGENWVTAKKSVVPRCECDNVILQAIAMMADAYLEFARAAKKAAKAAPVEAKTEAAPAAEAPAPQPSEQADLLKALSAILCPASTQDQATAAELPAQDTAPASKDQHKSQSPCGGIEPAVEEIGIVVEEDGTISTFSDHDLMRAEIDGLDPEYEEGSNAAGQGLPRPLEQGSDLQIAIFEHQDWSDWVSGPSYSSEEELDQDTCGGGFLEPEPDSAYKSHKNQGLGGGDGAGPRPCGSAFGWSDDEPFWQHIFGC